MDSTLSQAESGLSWARGHEDSAQSTWHQETLPQHPLPLFSPPYGMCDWCVQTQSHNHDSR